MKTRNKERYKELSEHAEVEDDPKKLRKIASEINRILKAEINRLEKKTDPMDPNRERRMCPEPHRPGPVNRPQ